MGRVKKEQGLIGHEVSGRALRCVHCNNPWEGNHEVRVIKKKGGEVLRTICKLAKVPWTEADA